MNTINRPGWSHQKFYTPQELVFLGIPHPRVCSQSNKQYKTHSNPTCKFCSWLPQECIDFFPTYILAHSWSKCPVQSLCIFHQDNIHLWVGSPQSIFRIAETLVLTTDRRCCQGWFQVGWPLLNRCLVLGQPVSATVRLVVLRLWNWWMMVIGLM